MAEEEKDEDTVTEAVDELATLKEHTDALELETLMRGDYDDNDAVLSLHAGAGGTEAQDWTSMLFRMYTRYCEKMGFTVKVLDLLDGDEAGIKSVTFEVSGDHAYGYLRGEKRRAPPRPHLPVRRKRPPPHILRVAGRRPHAGGR